MNAQELKEALNDDDIYDVDEVEGITIVVKGKTEADGKWCFTTTIVKDDEGNHFRVTESHTNGGYWGDNEKGDTEVEQVVPREIVITKTVWDNV